MQSIGQMDIEDEENNLKGYIKMGAYSLKKQDFFYGEILKNGEKVQIMSIAKHYLNTPF